MEASAEAAMFMLPGASTDAPYGKSPSGKVRRQPTREQAQFMQKHGIAAADYGWKTAPREFAPEHAEKLRENIKKVHDAGRAYAEKRRQKMVELFGEDWKEKGHKVSELKIVKKVEQPDLPPAILEIPVKNRPRTSVGKKVATAAAEVAKNVDAWKSENAMALKTLTEMVQNANGAASAAQKEAATVREELARIRAAAETAQRTMASQKRPAPAGVSPRPGPEQIQATAGAPEKQKPTNSPTSRLSACPDGVSPALAQSTASERPRSAEPLRSGSLW